MKILWFVSQLNRAGGGERLVLEIEKELIKKGNEVLIVSDVVSEEASFSGKYDLSFVINLQSKYVHGDSYLKKASLKILSLKQLFVITKKFKPDMVFCQSEFDSIRIMVMSLFFRFPYRLFIFGQMYQFENDISKYSMVFKKHLDEILETYPGYREMMAEPPGIKKPFTWLINEVVSLLKYISVRRAEKIFVFSSQVKNEVELLYGRHPKIARGAIHEEDINLSVLKKPPALSEKLTFITVSRLEPKKRVDVIIRAFIEASIPGRLIVIGEGSQLKYLEKLKSSKNVEGHIDILGYVSDFERNRLLESADCFISMDVSDFVITAIEALAVGTRVIISKEFDLESINSDLSGIKVVEANDHELAEVLQSVAEIAPPSIKDLPYLQAMTWQNLAQECLN